MYFFRVPNAFSTDNKYVDKKTVEELHHFWDALNFKC